MRRKPNFGAVRQVAVKLVELPADEVRAQIHDALVLVQREATRTDTRPRLKRRVARLGARA